jgi:hypothetical protein
MMTPLYVRGHLQLHTVLGRDGETRQYSSSKRFHFSVMTSPPCPSNANKTKKKKPSTYEEETEDRVVTEEPEPGAKDG